jgi:O-antigen/teichoic acid export membrane protein
MQVHQAVARLRALLGEESDLATVLRGAGLVVIIRVLASAVGFVNVVLLARWMGSSEYGLYSFAIASMILLAYPAALGLPGAAVRFVAQYAAADDWQNVAGFMKVSSWLAFGCGALVAILLIGAVLLFESYPDPVYVAPTVLALAGIPIVTLSIVRSEAIRGLGWMALAWGPLQLGQPLLLLALVIILFVVTQLTAITAVGASIFAYAATLILQWGTLHARLGDSRRVEPKIQLRPWLAVAVSFLWISVANLIFLQAGVIVVGLFLKPQDVAIYSAAAATAGFVTLPIYAAAALGAPKFAALHAQHRRAELQALFANTIRWTFWPSLVIALVYAIIGSMVLRLFGPEFKQGYPALLILTLGLLSGAFVGPVVNLLTMTGHQRITARVQMTCAILAVVLGLAFTPVWGIGGTALAFAAVRVLMNVCLTLSVVRKLEIFPLLLVR